MLAQMISTDEATLNALRNGAPIPDQKLQALHEFTRKMVEKRGFVNDADIEAFLCGGLYQRQRSGCCSRGGVESDEQLHQPYHQNAAR